MGKNYCFTKVSKNGGRYVVCVPNSKLELPSKSGLKATTYPIGTKRTGYVVEMVKKHGGYGKHKEWRKIKK